MTDDTFMTYFEDGEIDKLTIHKAEKPGISNFALRLFCRIKYMIHS